MATENILIKFTSDTSGLKDSVAELQKIGKLSEEDAKKFQMMEGFAEGVADALKEAGIDAKTLNKEIGSTVNSGKSLKAQFSDAKNEAVKLSREFGATSVQARNAAKSAALLKDEIDDMNGVLKALNPEAKLNAFVNLGQGVQGAFQAATGALQVFGVENERITKLAQQFQGVLNLTQGINSVLQLKDVYTQLRLVLGVTATAQRGLNTAMLANPAVILIATVIALGAAFLAFSDDTDEADKSQKKLKKSAEETNEELERQFKNLTSLDDLNRRGTQSAENVVLRIKSGTDLLAFSTNELNNALSNLKEQYDELTPENIVLFDPNGVKTQQDLTNEYNIQKNELARLISTIEKYIDKKKIVKVADREKLADLKLINLAERNAFEQSKDALGLTEKQIEAVRKLGIEGLKASEEFLGLTDSQIEGLDAIKAYAEGNFVALREYLNKVKKEIKDGVKESGIEVKKATKDYAAENEKIAELSAGLALETFNFLGQLGDNQTQREIDRVEDEKERGVISEEQYQEKLKKIKLDAAKQDKELAIFSATVALAEALVKALTTKNPPAALILASAVGALNLARIIATPLPRFKEGTLNVGGGNLDADGGMHAVIHRGEAIIPADRNREYHPTIKALYNRQVKASEINAFVQNKLSGKMNHNVNAKINTKELARAMDKGNTVKIENASAVGRVIANELSKGYNRRNII